MKKRECLQCALSPRRRAQSRRSTPAGHSAPQWSAGAHPEKHVAGFLWASGEDFSRNTLLAHMVRPAPDPDDEDYDYLRAVWDMGYWGGPDKAEAFHWLLVANQLRACAAGKYPPGLRLGGPIAIACIDAGGIAIKTIDESEIGALLETGHAAAAQG